MRYTSRLENHLSYISLINQDDQAQYVQPFSKKSWPTKRPTLSNVFNFGKRKQKMLRTHVFPFHIRFPLAYSNSLGSAQCQGDTF